jgi:RNA polymerase sigma factor (sigma-70 family)
MSVMEREIHGSLVELAASGDEAAFARIVAACHDDMARVCFVVCRDTELAQEATQAAWPIAWRKLDSIRDPERLRPWLIAIAANEARQVMRRRGRRALREIPIEPIAGDGIGVQHGDPAGRIAEIDLANAMARLSLEDRAMVAMRYVAGLTSSEIGSAIGMSPGGVRTRLARLLARLREDLGDV